MHWGHFWRISVECSAWNAKSSLADPQRRGRMKGHYMAEKGQVLPVWLHRQVMLDLGLFARSWSWRVYSPHCSVFDHATSLPSLFLLLLTNLVITYLYHILRTHVVLSECTWRFRGFPLWHEMRMPRRYSKYYSFDRENIFCIHMWMMC